MLNPVFFERVLVNPLVGENGRVILPGKGDGTTDGGNKDTADKSSTPSTADSGHDQAVDRRNAGADDERRSNGEGTSDASEGVTADTDVPAMAPHLVNFADTNSSVIVSALLTPPFDRLARPGLHAAAHTHQLQHEAKPGDLITPRIADDVPPGSTTRRRPTPTGERPSSSETTSQPVSTGAGLGRSLLARLAGLEQDKQKSLPDDFPWDGIDAACERSRLKGVKLPDVNAQGPCPSTTMPHLIGALGLRNT